MSTKKIGIITFQNADNYGALLQAYALKYTLGTQGHTVHVLDYLCPKLKNDYALFPQFEWTRRWLFNQTKRLLLFPLACYIRSQFTRFRKQYLQDTPPLSPEQLSGCCAQYDFFISGSDQVFNPRITGFDRNYFLAFNQDVTKNYSYAASFGLKLEDLNAKERTFIKENLLYFNHISVREQQGAQIVQTLTDREATMHLDPTLLLNKAQWSTLAVRPKYTNYVLLYLMYKDPQLIAFAKKLARIKGLKLLYISSSLDIKNRVLAKHLTPTPQEWLGLFLNATYVITNSFHGFAFAVNFNKTFFLGRLPERLSVNSRLDNLIDITGLRARLYTNFIENFEGAIDWNAVNQKLDKERQRALAYLKEMTQ